MDHVLNSLAVNTGLRLSSASSMFQPASWLVAKAFSMASIEEARTRPQLCAQTDAMHLPLKLN